MFLKLHLVMTVRKVANTSLTTHFLVSVYTVLESLCDVSIYLSYLFTTGM